MLTKTYKVYNSQTLKSCHITGYHLLKSLSSMHDKQTIMYAVRELKKTGNAHLSPLSIDLVR